MEIVRRDPARLRLEVLPMATRRAFLYCTKMPLFTKSGWYLAGGTALALQVGHRRSVDLDFFTTQRRFQIIAFERELLATNNWKSTLKRRGTLYGELMGAKMSFIAYPFFRPSVQEIRCGTIRMLTPEDIAAMKIVAISQRGRKRDFVDLFWYVHNREPLPEVLQRAVLQYPGQEHNLTHILKSLTYFTDAENDPMPAVYFKVNWRTVKSYFAREVPKVAKEFLLRA